MGLYQVAAAVYPTIVHKTASYQIHPRDVGVIFTNRGATGAVTFTLPPTTSLPPGWNCSFFIVANQTVTIASFGSADNIVTSNDAGADSIAFDQANEKVGNGARFVWDGTGWLAFLNRGEAVTITIA